MNLLETHRFGEYILLLFDLKLIVVLGVIIFGKQTKLKHQFGNI